MANKIMLQVKDKDSDVTRIECDDFTYNVDTRDLNLYDITEGDRKKLIAGF